MDTKLGSLLCSVFLAGLKSLHVAGQELCLALAELDADRFAHLLVVNDGSLLKQCAEDSNVCTLGVANAFSNAVCVAVDDLDVGALCLAVDQRAVDNQNAAGLNVSLELVQRRTCLLYTSPSPRDA